MSQQIVTSNLLEKMKDINTYFDKIYIINLSKRVDRWDKMLIKTNKYNIKNYIQFPAINGYDEPYYSKWRQIKGFFETPGAFGVIMSVYNVLLDAIHNKYKSILILEDDVLFHKNFNYLFKLHTQYIPEYWKLLFLGSSMHSWRINERCILKNGYLIPKGSIPGAFALGIKSDIYNQLISLILQCRSAWDLEPIKIINKMYYKQCFVIFPNIIISDTRDSNIRNGKNLNKKARDCLWDLKNYDID
tara:strand:- start:3570 stop:4304 length:735 start_codon:yes stop_codon:yes gene_type:complete